MAKKIIRFLQKCVEEVIPMCTFSIMFIVFIVQIIARYIFRSPLSWAYEVTVMCYLWTVMYGACYTTRKKSHVKFTMLYDALKPKGKAVLVFLGDLIIAAAFLIMSLPVIKFIGQMKMQVTGVFKIGLNVIYFPFIPFMFIVLAYTLYEMWQCIQVLTGIGGQAAVDAFLNEGKTDAEQAVAEAIAQNAQHGKED